MTDAQRRASRLNGALSHGPIAEEGKAKVRGNAIKTGIYAETEVLSTEDPEEYSQLVISYHERHQPDGPIESFLLDTLIRCEWTLKRLANIEQSYWNENIRIAMAQRPDSTEPLGRILNDEDTGAGVFEHIQRRINATNRNYHKALKEFQALQEARRSVQPQQNTEAPTAPGFVFTNSPARVSEPADAPAEPAVAPSVTPKSVQSAPSPAKTPPPEVQLP